MVGPRPTRFTTGAGAPHLPNRDRPPATSRGSAGTTLLIRQATAGHQPSKGHQRPATDRPRRAVSTGAVGTPAKVIPQPPVKGKQPEWPDCTGARESAPLASRLRSPSLRGTGLRGTGHWPRSRSPPAPVSEFPLERSWLGHGQPGLPLADPSGCESSRQKPADRTQPRSAESRSDRLHSTQQVSP